MLFRSSFPGGLVVLRSPGKASKLSKMKAFFLWTATSASALLLSAVAGASSGDAPTVAGPYTELRKTPVFTSPVLPLAKTWGPTLPVGTGFQVEKVYGRWIYGRPLPLKNMRSHDFAPQGWLFSRMLLLPGDSDSLSASVRKQSHSKIGRAHV